MFDVKLLANLLLNSQFKPLMDLAEKEGVPFFQAQNVHQLKVIAAKILLPKDNKVSSFFHVLIKSGFDLKKMSPGYEEYEQARNASYYENLETAEQQFTELFKKNYRYNPETQFFHALLLGDQQAIEFFEKNPALAGTISIKEHNAFFFALQSFYFYTAYLLNQNTISDYLLVAMSFASSIKMTVNFLEKFGKEIIQPDSFLIGKKAIKIINDKQQEFLNLPILNGQTMLEKIKFIEKQLELYQEIPAAIKKLDFTIYQTEQHRQKYFSSYLKFYNYTIEQFCIMQLIDYIKPVPVVCQTLFNRKPTIEIFDICCGYAFIAVSLIKYLSDHGYDCEYIGVDISEDSTNEIKNIFRNYPNVKIIQADAADPIKLQKLINKKKNSIPLAVLSHPDLVNHEHRAAFIEIIQKTVPYFLRSNGTLLTCFYHLDEVKLFLECSKGLYQDMKFYDPEETEIVYTSDGSALAPFSHFLICKPTPRLELKNNNEIELQEMQPAENTPLLALTMSAKN